MAKLSPMMAQYAKIKENHQDHILFFRLGDFYEMFYEDAKLCSKELELTLTGKDCGAAERAPMCGLPHHSCEAYIARLVKKGYKVAICEQIEEAKPGRGLVEREVVRVITPGTVIEHSILDDSKNNYIASVYSNHEEVALIFSDISTGEVFFTLSNEKEFKNELLKFQPTEILIDISMEQDKALGDFIKNKMNATVSVESFSNISIADQLQLIQHQFSCEKQLKPFYGNSTVISAISAFLCYLKNTQKKGLERLNQIHFYENQEFLQLGPTAIQNLELVQTMKHGGTKGSLLWVLDKTATSMGKRLLRKYIEKPLVNPVAIEKRLQGVEELYDNFSMRTALSENLQQVLDMERLLTRIVYGTSTPRELRSLFHTLLVLPEMKYNLSQSTTKLLREIYETMDCLEDVAKLIDTAIHPESPATMKDGEFIRDGYHEEVDKLRHIMKNGKQLLFDYCEKTKEETKIKNLKISYNKIFGYYLEVTKSYENCVPDYFIRRQTLANCERYITEELKVLENQILGANDKILPLEKKLFAELCITISKEMARIQSTANQVANIDVLTSFAKVAFTNRYVKPVVDFSDTIDIKDGRHPVVEQLVDDFFVPNHSLLDTKKQMIHIVTGPNMAGKSTYMRQTALIVVMAQMGSFVPASAANIGVVDKVFTRVGASDDLFTGKSTFMIEMTEVAEILENATSKSLLILDEIGRGTSTFDGMSIAKSVVEYVAHQMKAKTMFATHYHELISMEEEISCIKNYNIAVKKNKEEIIFLRKIVQGGTDDSYGIDVANLAKVPKQVVKRAREILVELETQGARTPVAKSQSPEKEIPLNFFERQALQSLQALDFEILSPIEAVGELYKIQKQLNEQR